LTLSTGGRRYGGKEVHKSLLSGGVHLVDEPDLSVAGSELCLMNCLPQSLVDGDGAPEGLVLKHTRRTPRRISPLTAEGVR